MVRLLILGVLISGVFMACKPKNELPVYRKNIEFLHEFTDQEGRTVNAEMLKDKIVVADFFFTHCPAICPKMTEQMLRLQEAYSHKKDLKLISYSIDVERDTVARLKWYADRAGVNADLWHMVTSEEEHIDDMADMLKVYQEEDENAPGGFGHQGTFVLIDKEGRMRGAYNGTDADDITDLIAHLKLL